MENVVWEEWGANVCGGDSQQLLSLPRLWGWTQSSPPPPEWPSIDGTLEQAQGSNVGDSIVGWT